MTLERRIALLRDKRTLWRVAIFLQHVEQFLDEKIAENDRAQEQAAGDESVDCCFVGESHICPIAENNAYLKIKKYIETWEGLC